MKRIVMVMLAVALLTRVSGGQDIPADLKKMAGTWKTVIHEADGKPTPKELIDKTAGKLIVEGDRYKAYFGDKLADEGTIRLDPATTPKEIDVFPSKDKVMKGIYKIDGDEMSVCFGRPGGERPTEFKTKEGTFQLLLGYQRVKK